LLYPPLKKCLVWLYWYKVSVNLVKNRKEKFSGIFYSCSFTSQKIVAAVSPSNCLVGHRPPPILVKEDLFIFAYCWVILGLSLNKYFRHRIKDTGEERVSWNTLAKIIHHTVHREEAELGPFPCRNHLLFEKHLGLLGTSVFPLSAWHGCCQGPPVLSSVPSPAPFWLGCSKEVLVSLSELVLKGAFLPWQENMLGVSPSFYIVLSVENADRCLEISVWALLQSPASTLGLPYFHTFLVLSRESR
jgi:hypothetical protein